MSGSHWVRWGDHLVPRIMCEPDLDAAKPGTCPHCGGVGAYPESIDEERYDEMMPCFWCREFCKACQRYVKKGGHECSPVEAKP